MPGRSRFTVTKYVLLCVVVILVAPIHGSAWGDIGHRIVARIGNPHNDAVGQDAANRTALTIATDNRDVLGDTFGRQGDIVPAAAGGEECRERGGESSNDRSQSSAGPHLSFAFQEAPSGATIATCQGPGTPPQGHPST